MLTVRGPLNRAKIRPRSRKSSAASSVRSPRRQQQHWTLTLLDRFLANRYSTNAKKQLSEAPALAVLHKSFDSEELVRLVRLAAEARGTR
jgi:hypothetical protein